MNLNKHLPWIGLFPLMLLGWLLIVLDKVSIPFLAVLGLSILTLWLCSLLGRGITEETQWILLILAAGFLLKLLYVLYTGVGNRQHDVHSFTDSTNGHAGYIRYLMENGHLPDFDPREQFQFYHPPLHHILSALWMKFNLLLGNGSWENLQLLPLFYTSACMILMERLLRELRFSGRPLCLALTVFCFHPYFIFLSGSVNNDALAILFMLLAMLYTLRWSHKPCMRNIIFLALAIGLGMSSKLSAAYMAPATTLVFLWKLLHTRGWIRSLLPQFIVFALICLPLGLWWYIRCYVLFGLPFGYVPTLSTDSSQYLGTSYTALQRLFDLSAEQFQYLYISYGKEGATYLEHNILLALLKSSVFEEQTLTRYNELIQPVSALLFCANLGLAAASLYGMYQNAKRLNTEENLTLYVTYGLALISFLIFCFRYPHVCTQSYRYAVPTLFVGIPALAALRERGSSPRLTGITILFCVSSTAQFLLLGI